MAKRGERRRIKGVRYRRNGRGVEREVEEKLITEIHGSKNGDGRTRNDRGRKTRKWK